MSSEETRGTDDEEAATKLAAKLKQRGFVIKELVSTERTYVEQLQVEKKVS